ncbi:MAG: rhomboid family intramembrane serine protease [Pseudomonadota bacterium]
MTQPLPAPIKHFILICVFLEFCALTGMVMGFGPTVRNLMLLAGGFWPGMLFGGPSLYPGQPVTMFASSAFLHANLTHLAMNMIGLVWLGPMIVNRLGVQAFWPIAGLTAIGSGLVFTWLSSTMTPMVGASGVIFGLLGVVAIWDLLDRIRRRDSLRPLIQHALVFLALNVALTLLYPGAIAWQAHLGGLLAGGLCGVLTWRGRRRSQLL